MYPDHLGFAEPYRDKFQVGDKVKKVRGYPYPGIVVSSFFTLSRLRRNVVESTVLPGMLHIFNDDQLELDDGL